MEFTITDREVRNENGRLASSKEVAYLIGVLEKEKKRALGREWATIECEWVFPQNEPRDLYASGTCVYFLRCSGAQAGLVKIGQTSCLSQRIKAIARKYKGKIKVMAFAKTMRHKDFEKAMHFKFADAGIRREWFREAPIMEYLAKTQEAQNICCV